MTMASNIVVEWLRSLHLGQYSESFIDNGYDDLEICKQIGDPDLDAIGVFNQKHRARLLQSVKTLREEGAASVYFTLEETNDNGCDNVSSKSSRTSSDRPSSDKETQRASPTASSSSGGQELTKFADEYEEGKAELVRIPRMQLRMLLQEKLRHDGIRLACQPYTTPEGERGYLEGLASRYADLFRTHYGDVLEPLEELRRRETNATARMPNTQLTTSHSQPIYVPGKYSPSSCLSDKEEDEIYGFGYGVFSRQMLQHRQQKLALATQNTTGAVTPAGPQATYQSCLSPRSAFFYEFPPNGNMCNDCMARVPYATLIATIMCCLGVGIFCGTMYRGATLCALMMEQVFHLHLGWLEIVQLVFASIGACMAALGFMILCVGCLATGATRHKVYRAWRSRVGGRISCAVFMTIIYILQIAWLLIFAFLIVTTMIFTIFWGLCSNPRVQSLDDCINFTQFAFLFPNNTRPQDLEVCGSQEVKLFCKDFVEKSEVMFILATVAAMLVILSLIHYLMCLSANYAHIRDHEKFQELQELQYLQDAADPDSPQGMGTLSSHRGKDRF